DYEFKTPYFAGRTWEDEGKTIFFAREISVTTTVTIEKIDDVVTIPAGTFENCLRVKSHSNVQNTEGVIIKKEHYAWYAPGLGFIKSIYKEECSDPSLGKGGTLTYQLVSYTRQ
ncbi:MAG: hypothetical protein U9R21_07610, partial [Candidatus Thermoplasmatota archaeon]|nr:hypothetical protein [Candidatus Thermoplasmatota archaeon]